MDVFLFFIIFMAFAHFIYDGIIAPTIRRKLHGDLYAARDELRRLHAAGECPDDAYEIFDNGIEQFLHHLSAITITSQLRFRRRYQNDAKLRALVDGRIAVLRRCKTPALHALSKELDRVTSAAFLSNMGVWFLYLVPIAVAAAMINVVKRWALALFSTPAGSKDIFDDHCAV
ncbi:MAG TPA: hypothetical protein VGH80_14305 [Xanthomonadaceae bacterium]